MDNRSKDQQIPAAVLRRDDEGGPLPQMVAQRREQLRQEREASPSSNQIHELRVMASGMAGNVDEADDHSEVKLLRWAAAEIERLRPMAESWESYEAAQERKAQMRQDETTPVLSVTKCRDCHGSGEEPPDEIGGKGRGGCLTCGGSGVQRVETVGKDAEDMANIGRALMERLPKDYHWNDCPTEIVTDLGNQIYDLKASVAEACEYLRRGAALVAMAGDQSMALSMNRHAERILSYSPEEPSGRQADDGHCPECAAYIAEGAPHAWKCPRERHCVCGLAVIPEGELRMEVGPTTHRLAGPCFQTSSVKASGERCTHWLSGEHKFEEKWATMCKCGAVNGVGDEV